MVFFPALIFYLFLLKCSDAHLCLLQTIIYWKKNDVEKRKKLRGCTLAKLATRTPRGLFKVKIYDAVFVYLLITSNKCHKLPSCAYCQLWTFFACKTFHSIQHSLYKTSIFHISWSFNSLFFNCTLIAANL